MNLTKDEKKILNAVFTDVSNLTREKVLISLYAAKPENDGTQDATKLVNLLNTLITKIFKAEPDTLKALFDGIPYDL